jgi:MGT family glycosyltransferase
MKILLVPFAPSLAHITRCLSVAESMKARGHDCRFALGSEGEGIIRKAGFTTYLLPDISGEVFRNVKGWGWLSKSYIRENLSAELNIIDEFRPDLIIYDFRFTTLLAGKIRNIPTVSILHSTALALMLEPKSTARKLISSDRKSPAIFRFIFPSVFTWIIRRPLRYFKPYLKRYRLKKPKTVFNMLMGDLVLVADPAELISPGVELPDNCILAGPLTWSGWENKFTWPEPTSKPIIYITMGSTVEALPLLHKLLDAVSTLPYNIIVSTGSMKFDYKDKPENLHLFSYVPGKAAATISSLVIYHGGHETLMQVLSAGVPSMVIPVNPDQILVAKQIRELGLGDYLRSPGSFPMEKDPLKKISTLEIREEVLRIIGDDSCRIRCMELKEKMNDYIDRKSYIKNLEDLL